MSLEPVERLTLLNTIQFNWKYAIPRVHPIQRGTIWELHTLTVIDSWPHIVTSFTVALVKQQLDKQEVRLDRGFK